MANTPLKARVQLPAPGSLVDLFHLDLRKLGGPQLFFAPEVEEDQAVVSFGGIAFPPIPVSIKGFERNAKDPFPRPRCTMSNISKLGSSLIAEFDDLVGGVIKHIQTFAEHLDGGSDPDPGQFFPLNIYKVERLVRQEGDEVEWELSSAIDQQDRKLPGRQVLRSCDYNYRLFNEVTGLHEYDQSERACPYTGAACFDINNNPTDAANDMCPHTVPACKLRFGPFAELPYGGFPGAGLSTE